MIHILFLQFWYYRKKKERKKQIFIRLHTLTNKIKTSKKKYYLLFIKNIVFMYVCMQERWLPMMFFGNKSFIKEGRQFKPWLFHSSLSVVSLLVAWVCPTAQAVDVLIIPVHNKNRNGNVMSEEENHRDFHCENILRGIAIRVFGLYVQSSALISETASVPKYLSQDVPVGPTNGVVYIYALLCQLFRFVFGSVSNLLQR